MSRHSEWSLCLLRQLVRKAHSCPTIRLPTELFPALFLTLIPLNSIPDTLWSKELYGSRASTTALSASASLFEMVHQSSFCLAYSCMIIHIPLRMFWLVWNTALYLLNELNIYSCSEDNLHAVITFSQSLKFVAEIWQSIHWNIWMFPYSISLMLRLFLSCNPLVLYSY